VINLYKFGMHSQMIMNHNAMQSEVFFDYFIYSYNP